VNGGGHVECLNAVFNMTTLCCSDRDESFLKLIDPGKACMLHFLCTILYIDVDAAYCLIDYQISGILQYGFVVLCLAWFYIEAVTCNLRSWVHVNVSPLQDCTKIVYKISAASWQVSDIWNLKQALNIVSISQYLSDVEMESLVLTHSYCWYKLTLSVCKAGAVLLVCVVNWHCMSIIRAWTSTVLLAGSRMLSLHFHQQLLFWVLFDCLSCNCEHCSLRCAEKNDFTLTRRDC